MAVLDRAGFRGLPFFHASLRDGGLEPEAAKSITDTAASLLDPQADDPTGMQRRWYAALRSGAPDFSVYGERDYLAEAYYCWSRYSRRYLRGIAAMGLSDVQTIMDVGCGIGFSTAALREMFPNSRVIGTNVHGTPQWAVCSALAERYGFDLMPVVPRLDVGLLFASEYFEHFDAPLEQLATVLDGARPRCLFVANTFGSPGVGHFDTYRVGSDRLRGAAVSRAFGAALRARGYEKQATGFWNNRPAYWRLP